MTVARCRKKRNGEKLRSDDTISQWRNSLTLPGDMVLVSDAVGTVGLSRSEAVSVSVEDDLYSAVSRG
jgi:hypothetical protein